MGICIYRQNNKEDDLVTDKELKKLSRLELLELLLTESRENERLREELEKIKQENTIKKSAEHLNETSENLGEASEKLQEALRQVSSIISGLDRINGIMVEEKTVSVSDDVDENDKTDKIQEEQVICEENEPEVSVEDKTDSCEEEAVENSTHNDISKRLDRALKLVSSKIEELDRLADIVDADKESRTFYDKN